MYELDVRGLNPDRDFFFSFFFFLSFFQSVQIVSGVHQVSYSLGTEVHSRGVKRPGREMNHSHLVPRIRMDGAMPLVLLYVFVAQTGKSLPLLYALYSCVKLRRRHVWAGNYLDPIRLHIHL